LPDGTGKPEAKTEKRETKKSYLAGKVKAMKCRDNPREQTSTAKSSEGVNGNN